LQNKCYSFAKNFFYRPYPVISGNELVIEMALRSVSLSLILLFYLISARSQPFGGNPPSLKWRQANNDTARIIFPKGLEEQGIQVFSIVNELSKKTSSTIGDRQYKINIIFQNQTIVSNGYVQLAPFKSEFQLTADQNSFELGSLPWDEQLAIHEYRHVQQYNNYRIGLSKVFYYLFGQGGQELANSLSIPNWFWEGDAVYQETLVSKQGRGRLPDFFNGYRSLWVADKNYSWMKLRNGSLRDYVPDHYPLGYMMVAYGREKYGDDFWKKVTLDAASFRGVFYPLQKGIKKYSGQSFTEFGRGARDHFRQQINEESESDSVSIFAKKNRHFVADEESPQFLDSNHIIYVRTSFKRPHAFMLRDLRDQTEKKIRTRSVSLDNYFSYRNHKVVYAAYEPDLRWGWRDFNVIRVLDIQTGEERRITTRSKYFSPDISSDGLYIAAVESSTDGKTTLHILNSNTGAVEKKVPNPNNLFYTYPKFYKEQELVSAMRNGKGEMAIGIVNISDGKVDWLTPFSMNVIGFLSVKNDTIYFSASHNGHDQLFAVSDHQIFEISSGGMQSITGNYQLQSEFGKYAFTSFTAVGYKMSIAGSEQFNTAPISGGQWAAPLITQQIHSLNKNNADLLDSIPLLNPTIRSYSPSFQLINFHSWRPYISDPDYSFALVSENVMNTLQSEIFVDYNRNEQYTRIGADAVYGAFFPWIDMGINYTFNRNALYRNQKVFWNELEASAGLTIPLNLSRGRWYTNLQFGSDIVYNQRYYEGAYKDSFNNRAFAYINPSINFTNQVQSGQQQIYPSLAQTISLTYDRAVTTFEGNQFLSSGYFYFPGLTATHSLVLTAAFQQRDSLNNVRFSNSFPFSRGYSGENFYRMFRLGANYHFPLVYPDWGFADIVYFLRIRANLFFDYTKVPYFSTNGGGVQPQYRSYGTEIYFDTKWWNQLPISFGIRYSHLMDPDYEGRSPNQWEFILPISLLSK
jgi:hypothetical protein